MEELWKAKEIREKRSKFYTERVLKELHCALYAKHFFGSLKNEKYNSKNSKHESKLLEVWQNLKPNEKLRDRISTQWISIGFQAEDPSTDFRGAGFLGLTNLHTFSQTPLCKTKIFPVAV